MGGPAIEHRDGALRGVGAVRLYWQAWLPEREPRAVVALAHGAGEHGGRYTHVAAALVSAGFAVYSIDHRGHGRSGGRRALIDRMEHAVADLDGLILMVREHHPSGKLFLLGHSMGATISLRYAISHQDRLDGLALSGPLAALKAASPPVRAIAQLLSALAPALPVVAVEEALVSRDPVVVAAYRADPMVHHGKLPARTVAELAAAVASFPAEVPRIVVPTLIMYGTADGLCPTSGSMMLAERIGAEDKTIKPYVGLYHEIFNEPEQQRVLEDLCEWLVLRSQSS